MTDEAPSGIARKGAHYFALPVGAELFEFEIEKVLGHGGFGITYLARDNHLQERVAIKEYLPNELAVRVSDATVRAKTDGDHDNFQSGLKAFLEEARVLARFRHPNIVHVRRFFEMHGTGYIVLDFEYGQTLSERMNAGPVRETELRDIISGIIAGLDAVHSQAILHRDLKPSNIILRADNSPVLIDFGAARDFQGRFSRSITAIASAGYSPPEQYGVGGQQGPWTDIYALGAIAYQSVTGVAPIDSLRRLRNDPLQPATEIAKGKYDHDLLETIDWMLDLDEAERPSSVQEVQDALASPQNFDRKRPPSAYRQRKIGNPAKERRWRWSVAATALTIVVAAAAAFGLYTFVDQKSLPLKGSSLSSVQLHAEQISSKITEVGYDQDKLQELLVQCGQSCPAQLRNEIKLRQETVAAEDRIYRSTGESLDSIQNYIRQCKACLFKSQAEAKISRIEEEDKRRRQADSDKQQLIARLANVGNDVTAIERFLTACGNSCPADIRALANRMAALAKDSSMTNVLNECDRQAVHPLDTTAPPGISPVDFSRLDSVKAIAACRSAHSAKPDDARIALQLGRSLAKAGDAVSAAEAVSLYTQAATGGSVVAMTSLGMAYRDGTGTMANAVEAARWFRRAAAQDYMDAVFVLADLYRRGVGTDRNSDEALRLLRKAASAGHKGAMNSLGGMIADGDGVPSDASEAYRWYRKSAEAGFGPAMNNVGRALEEGKGVNRNEEEALRWYRAGSEAGSQGARQNLNRLEAATMSRNLNPNVVTYWDYNGSVFYLQADGKSRKFYYHLPREGLLSEGVKHGTLLVDASRSGDTYSGMAYVFNKNCGARSYPVSGNVSADEREVSLVGRAPRRNANCDIVEFREDALKFVFRPSGAP